MTQRARGDRLAPMKTTSLLLVLCAVVAAATLNRPLLSVVSDRTSQERAIEAGPLPAPEPLVLQETPRLRVEEIHGPSSLEKGPGKDLRSGSIIPPAPSALPVADTALR